MIFLLLCGWFGVSLLTMTRLTRETALALIPSRCIQPNMCRMIIHTTIMRTAAAQMFKPNIRTVTKNTAATCTGREEREWKV